MKLLSAVQITRDRFAATLLCCFLIVTSGAAFAQTTGTVNPNAAPIEPKENEDLPPGGCMPIGLTASGEVVFPFQCKNFIERQKSADRKAAAPEEKPAKEEDGPAAETGGQMPPILDATPSQDAVSAEVKSAGMQEDSKPTIVKPADKPVEKPRLQKRVQREPRQRAIGPPGCTRFRSYDPESGTYRNYEGRRLLCQ